MVIRIVGLIVSILVLIPVLTGIERWALRGSLEIWHTGVSAGSGLYGVRGKRGDEEPLLFEVRSAAAFELLKLA